jgi:hypothetical protein
MFGFGKKQNSPDRSRSTDMNNSGLHGESSPLLPNSNSTTLPPSNASGGSSTNYYFLGKGSMDYQGGTSDAVRDGDGGEVVEGLPPGATTDEFAPKLLGIPAVR